MCGITGLVELRPGRDALVPAVSAMTDAMRHRGPDGRGTWADEGARIALGHRRLAIQDLSDAGAQPMHSESGRYVITYNGEVYNAPDLRRVLEGLGHRFRGTSDTEVLLAAFEQWGLRRSAERFVGMFALAVWDRRERAMHLLRDRLGIKPLYYGFVAGRFLFGSELKALRAHPAWSADIDRDSVALQLRHSYIPAPWSVYSGVYKLMPGCLLTVPSSADPAGFDPLPREDGGRGSWRPESYWRAADVYERAAKEPFTGTEDDALEAVEEALRASIRGRMLSDVPLGAFLSGGIDSSTVAALMVAENLHTRTFCIGFEHAQFDESHHARAVAAHLGTEHTELFVGPTDALDLVPSLPALYDEPFSDSSQIPTAILCALTRGQVAVCLSGDGGDEVFGGYNRYVEVPRLWRAARWVPERVRRRAALGLTGVSIATYDRAFSAFSGVLPARLTSRPAGITIPKVAGVLAAVDRDALFRMLTSSWQAPGRVVLGAREHSTAWTDSARRASVEPFVRQMMHADLVGYMPGDILVKVDRASMASSLEVRVPLIDHRVIELAAAIPLSMHIKNGRSKNLLRRILDRHVPRTLLDRPKKGFGIPVSHWLKGPLREWAEGLLDERRLRQQGLLEPAPIRHRWREHLAGKRDWKQPLWDVLMLQAWLDTQ